MSRYACARAEVARAISRAIAPRKPGRVSEWATRRRRLSSKGSQLAGEWDNSRNPLQIEIMDCFSARSPVHDVVALLPIQFGKSEMEANVLGYSMEENPQPIMVVLPGEVSLNKWIDQKLNPLLEETPALQRILTSTNSRESSNRRGFKDFQGGQLYMEHAGNPVRLKSTAAGLLIVDEFSSFASALRSGDDPDEMLNGRTSAFPDTYKRFKVGTPEIVGRCRLTDLWADSDQRRWHWPCPDCGHEQVFEWSGLQWTPDGQHCWYACQECGVVIEEHQKTTLIARGRWIAAHPERKLRGYHANALYYPMGLGPRWHDLVQMWLAAQNDPARLKTFVNDRLAEAWEDPATRAVKHNIIADRVEPLPMRPVPRWVLAATAGIDTQDNRLAVQILGWGRGMACWPIDYVELPGDPAEDAVWTALTELLTRPIDHASGGWLMLDAAAQDIGGHRTEAVKAYIRRRLVRRLLAIFGATPNNAPVLGKGKLQDINWRGQLDKRGIHIHAVGTVGIKHLLYSRLSTDADKAPEDRLIRFSDQLDDAYLGGLVSETYNPQKNRFEKRRRAPRNEPLDTWVYGYAATHHPELRLQRWTKAQWDAREAQILARVETPAPSNDSRETSTPAPPRRAATPVKPTKRPAKRNRWADDL